MAVCDYCETKSSNARQCVLCGKYACSACAGETCKEGILCQTCSTVHFFSQDLVSGRLEVINRRTKSPVWRL